MLRERLLRQFMAVMFLYVWGGCGCRTAETVGSSGKLGNTRDERLGDVGLVVLDEVHYLGDPWRGSVWEEAIINCPRHIQVC